VTPEERQTLHEATKEALKNCPPWHRVWCIREPSIRIWTHQFAKTRDRQSLVRLRSRLRDAAVYDASRGKLSAQEMLLPRPCFRFPHSSAESW
jgi:hypothetical protein